jgi:RAD51-like protein 2
VAIKREIDAAFGWGAPTSSSSSASAAVGGHAVMGITALAALTREEASVGAKGVPTFCKELDELLGGGVKLGAVTEFCACARRRRRSSSATFCCPLPPSADPPTLPAPARPPHAHAGGAPGIGKTQLCMQLALDVQIPPELGGAGGSAVYIDTEGSMAPARLEQMASSLSRHLGSMARRRGSPALNEAVATRCAPLALMDRVHVYRCNSLAEQLALLCPPSGDGPLGAFLGAHPDVRLVLLDSVAFHFRYGGLDGEGSFLPAGTGSGGGGGGSGGASEAAARARLLQQMGGGLHRLAASYRLAVVVINQMTTKLDGAPTMYAAPSAAGGAGAGSSSSSSSDALDAHSGSGSSSRLVPALGETWAHVPTHRVLLQWGAPTADGSAPPRVAQLVKSATQPPGSCRYMVTEQGVRSFKPPGAAAAAAATAPSTSSAAADGGAGAGSSGSSSSAGRKRDAEQAGLPAAGGGR